MSATLTNRERRILQLRLGLHGRCHTLAEIGRTLDISPERVRQIQIKAVRKANLTDQVEDTG